MIIGGLPQHDAVLSQLIEPRLGDPIEAGVWAAQRLVVHPEGFCRTPDPAGIAGEYLHNGWAAL